MDEIEKDQVEQSNEHRMETNHMSGKYHNAPDTGLGHMMDPQEIPWENKNTKSTMDTIEENKNQATTVNNDKENYSIDEIETGQDEEITNNPLMV